MTPGRSARGRRLRAGAALLVGLGAALLAPATAQAAASPPLTISVATGSGNCPTVSGTIACGSDPTSLTASWPLSSFPSSVQVTFSTAGRPGAAPVPATNPVTLPVSTSCSLSDECTWPLPGGLAPAGGSGVLDGTYTATASGLAPATFTVAVAPAAPSDLRASAANGVVGLSWALGAEPDLAAYVVKRNGTPIYDCELNAGDAALPACPSSPTVTDQPGAGTWSYEVYAVRYGASPAPTQGSFVLSPASVVSVQVAPPPTATTTTTTPPGSSATTVPGSTTTTTTPGSPGGTPGHHGGTGSKGAGGSPTTTGASRSHGTHTSTAPGGTIALPPVQTSTATPSLSSAAPLPTLPEVTVPTGSSTPTTTPFGTYSSHLPYAKRHGSHPSATAAQEVGPVSSSHDVRGLALIAGALLALAVAAHIWFIRSESHRLAQRNGPGGPR